MSDRFRLLVLAFLLVLPLRAGAQQPDMSRKSPVRGTLYSLGGTVGPVAAGSALTYAAFRWDTTTGPAAFLQVPALKIGPGLVAAGLVVGPSLGHFYADAQGQARLGIGIRGGSLLVGGAASTLILSEMLLRTVRLFVFPLSSQSNRRSRTSRVAGYVATGAGVVWAGSVLFDIATVPFSVKEYNETNDLRVHVAPRVHPDLDQAGLAVRLQF